jgi:uncharacterized protein (DUF2267 family)
MKIFEDTYQKTHDWLKQLQEIGNFEDESQAYSAFRAVLHALRDRLTVDQAAHLASHLPMLIRGFYYEGYKPAAMPVKIRMLEQFLDHVAAEYQPPGDVTVEDACRAVFTLLTERVQATEIDKIRDMMPGELKELWP